MKYKFIGSYQLESLGDESIMLPKINGNFDLSHCIYLEGSAEEIIKLLEQNSDLNEVYQIMTEKYPGNDEAIKEDLNQLVMTLENAKILMKED